MYAHNVWISLLIPHYVDPICAAFLKKKWKCQAPNQTSLVVGENFPLLTLKIDCDIKEAQKVATLIEGILETLDVQYYCLVVVNMDAQLTAWRPSNIKNHSKEFVSGSPYRDMRKT